MKVDKITPAILNNWLTDERNKYDTLNESDIGGFHVRANQASIKGERASASYRVKYRAKGKPHVPSLGKTESISLKKVRKLAIDVIAKARLGDDILEERRQERVNTQKKPIIEKLPTLQQWFDNTHHDRLYNENRRTRINYFNRWLKLVGDKTLAEISIDDIALNLCKYGKKVKKESSHKKYVEYFKELASAYAADNKCINPIANTRWSAYLKASEMTYEHIEDKGNSRTAIEASVFLAITESLEGLMSKYPEKTAPYAFLFMAHTGMRNGDITSLQWSQIRRDDPTDLHIYKVLLKTKKKNPSPSKIPISPEAIKILDRVKNLSGGDYVFSETSKAKNTAGLRTVWWEKVQVDTGISFPPYQLRHNIAHNILRAGGTIADVAATLGNTVEVCIDRYLKNDTRHAAQVLMNMQL